MDGESIQGGCFCGAVRYEVRIPSKWCSHCHCSMCRRAHGAAFVTWFGVETARFQVIAGEDQLKRYASSAEASRSFCSLCGTTMFFESSQWPGEVHITLASLEGTLDRTPRAHVFYSDRADWLEIHDDLPKRGGATGVESLDGEE
jgi:hypothetical protein